MSQLSPNTLKNRVRLSNAPVAQLDNMNFSYKPQWEKVSTSTGYPIVYCPDHPKAWSTGYVYVHTIIAEQKLGRFLKPGEVIHHINENRFDYRPENIEITTQPKHAREHALNQNCNLVDFKCPECRSVFTKRRNNTFLVKGGAYATCSRKCNGKFSKRIQMDGYTEDVTKRISENIIKEYMSPCRQADKALVS